MSSQSSDKPDKIFPQEGKEVMHHTDLRRSQRYLELLLRDIEHLEPLLASGVPKRKRKAFQYLMMQFALSTHPSWERLRAVSRVLGLPSNTLERYVMGNSAPSPFICSTILKNMREAVVEECKEIERVAAPLEEAEQREREKRFLEWQAFRSRIETIIPGSGLNCHVRFPEIRSNEEEMPFEFMFAYPCRGIYELSEYFPLVCTICEKEGKEHSHSHGRVILGSEDGLMLLPHIVRTQNDLLQVISDMQLAEGKGRLVFANDHSWYEACKHYLSSHPTISALPRGDTTHVESHDLTQEKLSWYL